MDDLQSALQQLLADPQQLAELASMASALGLHPPEGGPPPQPPLSSMRPQRSEIIFSACRKVRRLVSSTPFCRPARAEALAL